MRKRGVEAFTDQIDLRIAQMQIHGQLRMEAEQFRQQRRHEQHAEGHGRRQPHLAPGGGGQRHGLAFRRLGFRQKRGGA